ncbi:hypothetical protein [Embleya sp. NPDC059259]|uniref:hypothetical protein n=1 Tax=unclassified Embleya TaxID=2699296 RepID=UPI0036B6F352
MLAWNNGSTTVPYEYDNAGNRTRDGPRTATYDQRNRLLGDGASTYQYTARGTLAKKTTAGGSAFTNLTYDAFDRLTADGSSTYTYDSLDRVLTSGGGNFGYSGTGNDLATDGGDLYGRGANGDLVGIRNGSTGQADLAVVDEHSDMVATFQPSGTALSRSVTYSPYGQVLDSSGPRTSEEGRCLPGWCASRPRRSRPTVGPMPGPTQSSRPVERRRLPIPVRKGSSIAVKCWSRTM